MYKSYKVSIKFPAFTVFTVTTIMTSANNIFTIIIVLNKKSFKQQTSQGKTCRSSICGKFVFCAVVLQSLMRCHKTWPFLMIFYKKKNYFVMFLPFSGKILFVQVYILLWTKKTLDKSFGMNRDTTKNNCTSILMASGWNAWQRRLNYIWQLFGMYCDTLASNQIKRGEPMLIDDAILAM